MERGGENGRVTGRASPRSPAASHPSSAGAEPNPDRIVELCAVRVGTEEYLIDLRRVREILQLLPVIVVPRTPPTIEGVVNVRGNIIPVVDVRKRLSSTSIPGTRGKVLVIDIAGRTLGLIVDGVSEVLRIPRSAIGPPPPMLSAGGPRLFLGVCGQREGTSGRGGAGARGISHRLRLLLNVKALIDPGVSNFELARQSEGEAVKT